MNRALRLLGMVACLLAVFSLPAWAAVPSSTQYVLQGGNAFAAGAVIVVCLVALMILSGIYRLHRK